MKVDSKQEEMVSGPQNTNPGHESEFPSFAPRVSIIIPVYNGAKYVRHAIECALNQTYRNCEVIVIDDGSVDNTREIAESYGERLRYFWKANGGVASALNLGIEKMDGAYFSWLSHDDGYTPDKVARQVECLRQETDRENVVFYSDYEVMNERDETLYPVRFDHSMLRQKPLYGLLRGSIHGCSLLIPRTLFSRIGRFDESLRVTQDYALWFEMIRVVPFKHIPEVMVRSRWHPEQDTKTKSTQFVIPECNSLWIRFQTQLNESEILSCEESVGRFFWELARFLESTPYDEARKFAYRRAAEQASDLTVSVIMPFFNRLSLTERALESIRSQTHQRMQILIVDDGSTDAVDQFSALAHNDQRVTWIRQENAGPAGARNNALGRVVGDFIAFLDSDDLWEPNKIEVQLREMVANNWAISHTSYIRVWSNGTEERISSASLQRDGLPRMIASCQMCTPSVMARRDVFARRRFPEGMRCGEDVITWLDIATETSIWGIDLPLAKVHVSEQSSAFDIEKSAVGLQNIYNFVRNDPRFESYPEEIGRIGAAAERYSQHAQALAKERAASAQPQICESATPTSPETTAVLSTPEPAPADLTSAPPALITSDPQASARESLPKGPNLKRLLKQAALLIPPVRRYVENHRGLVRELEDTRSRLNGNGKTRIEALASEVAALRAEVDKLLLEAGAKHDNNH